MIDVHILSFLVEHHNIYTSVRRLVPGCWCRSGVLLQLRSIGADSLDSLRGAFLLRHSLPAQSQSRENLGLFPHSAQFKRR